PEVKHLEQKSLELHRVVEAAPERGGARPVVSSGRALNATQLVIADPEKMTRCRPDQVGEIWVSSASVALGYWRNPEQTALTFNAYLADSGEGPFLRTGDLGFIMEG